MIRNFLTLDDLEVDGKTILVRVDINSPIDPKTGKIIENTRIREIVVTLRDLSSSKVVLCSHQGRVGRYDYVPLDQHAVALAELIDRKVSFIDDVMGGYALQRIKSLNDGEVLVLDNLRFVAEENYEFKPEKAASTIIVRRLSSVIDACVLDAFPTAHRAHPSIVGFAEVVPTAAGRLVVKELKSLSRISQISKAPFTTVLGGAKVSDRLEAISALIEGGKADKMLLCGVVGLVFLRAADIVKKPLGIPDEEKIVSQARRLLDAYQERFELPEDVAVNRDGERVEVPVNSVDDPAAVLDIGSKTIKRYIKIIKSSGTIFMSGPPGAFEYKGFETGTYEVLNAMANSLGTTVISGGHLSTALQQLKITEWIDYISTSGGALVMFLAGKKLPMFEALERAAAKWGKG